MSEVIFPVLVSPANAKEKISLLAGKEPRRCESDELIKADCHREKTIWLSFLALAFLQSMGHFIFALWQFSFYHSLV